MRLGKKIEPYVYLLPSIVIIVLFLGYPIIYNLVISFFQWNIRRPDRPFAGLSNYISVLSDGKFPVILWNTLLWAGVGVASQMVFGITLALFADSLRGLQEYMRTIILLPWLIPGVVTALMWKWMFQADVGIINFLLMYFKITKDNILFISSPAMALPTLIFVNSWRAVPFWFLMITAGLQDKPLDQIESARMDGARYPAVLWHVILPHLSPVIASTGVLTTIWTLNYFDGIYGTVLFHH